MNLKQDLAMPPAASSKLKEIITKTVVMVVLGLALGFAYDWAAPRIYSADRPADFQFGVVHGALMPVALPGLLMGKDLPIYAPNNSGRRYKLGYIAGINLCGLLFFGVLFRRPKSP
jgi:hypothetical protein